MKHPTTIIRSITCILVSSLVLGLLGCEKKRRRSRSSGNSSGNSTEQTSSDSVADKTSYGNDKKDPDKVSAPDIFDRRTPPATSGVTVAVHCASAGTLSMLDGKNNILATTTASSPIVRCELPQDVSSAVTLRFEPADGSPGTQRLLALPTGDSLVLRRLIAPTKNTDWQLKTIKEKPVSDKIASNPPTSKKPAINKPVQPSITPPAKPSTPVIPAPKKQPVTTSLADWVADQTWFKKRSSQMPAGVNLSVSISQAEKPGWEMIMIREVHTPRSGFDPNTSPLVATFRVSPDRKSVQWLNPLTGDWAGLAAFYQSRQTDQPTQPKAASKPPENLASNELAADLDQDGRYEIIRWTAFASTEYEKFYQITVVDDNGKTIWSGPKVKDANNAFIFLEADHGVSLPEFLHDINGDGQVELLAPEPQGDVSPISYRRLTWKQGQFHKMESCSLMLSSPASKSFQWKKTNTYYGIWIHNLGPVDAQGLVRGMVIHATKEGAVEQGSVLLKFNTQGATIEKWLKPIKGASTSSARPKTPNKPNPFSSNPANSEDDLLFTKTRDDLASKKIPAAEAFATYMMLAKRGHIDSVYAVGYLYYRGEGVQQDYQQAHRWISQAAAKGKPKALFRLGYLYGKGLGVTKDEHKAMEYYLPAAKAGNRPANLFVGLAYEFGRGVKIDKAEACVWYRKAAKLGSAAAMNNLGNSYYRGEGVKQDYLMARKWLLCGATRGNALAAHSMGSIYAYGRGVEKDPYKACQWWAVSARGGYSKAATKVEAMATENGWTNYELRDFPLPKEMADAKKGNLPNIPE